MLLKKELKRAENYALSEFLNKKNTAGKTIFPFNVLFIVKFDSFSFTSLTKRTITSGLGFSCG